MSDVSVIMVSYHTGAPLWLAIESVLAQSQCRELVLVDNGNVPGVQAILAKLAEKEPRFKLVTGHGNVGFAKGCNLGVRASNGSIVLLLNPDSMLPEQGLANALEVLRRYPENTLAGCYLINADGSEQRGCRRSLLTPKNAVAESLGLNFLAGNSALNLYGPMPEAAHEVSAISGAFMMLARTFYDRLGGLDEGYFLHMEDMDFCMRVHQAGGKTICMPEVKVVHFRSTSEVASDVVEQHKARSFIRYLNIHFSKSHSPIVLKVMALGIWLRYALKTTLGLADKIFVPPLAAKREIARNVLLNRLTRFEARDNSLAGKTVLVTGASGQTGLCVVGKALARGARVIAVTNQTLIAFSHPNLTWVSCDLREMPLEQKADILIHTAPLMLLPEQLEGILKGGVQRVVAFGCTLMFATVEMGNPFEQGLIQKLKSAEERISKMTAEKNAALTILRPTMTYGVGLDGNITRLADIARRFGILTVYGEGKGLRHPVQATDLADAALNICSNTSTYGKSYNLGGSQGMTYHTMLTQIFEYLGKPPRIVRPPMFPYALDWLGWIYQVEHVNAEMALRMNHDMVFDMKDAIADFGYHPKGYLQGTVVI